MLSPGKKRESLAGKLLLSSGLVAASLAYGWWQNTASPSPTAAPMPMPHAPKNSSMPAPDSSAMAAPAGAPATPATEDAALATRTRDASGQAAAVPRAPKSATVAMAGPRTNTQAAIPAAPTAQPQQTVMLPAPPPAPLTAQEALQMDLPIEGISPPLPPVTGTPAPGATASIPAGTHLEDGDYTSNTQVFEWGDLKVKISVHGGQITGVQIVQYPDHRAQSLYLSQMASPILDSEVIQTQQSKVDIVSSATDTSFAFQYAIASAIIKATRQ